MFELIFLVIVLTGDETGQVFVSSWGLSQSHEECNARGIELVYDMRAHYPDPEEHAFLFKCEPYDASQDLGL